MQVTVGVERAFHVHFDTSETEWEQLKTALKKVEDHLPATDAAMADMRKLRDFFGQIDNEIPPVYDDY